MIKERVTRDEYEAILADGIANDIDAGGPAMSQGETSREYVESYLRDQYHIIGDDIDE